MQGSLADIILNYFYFAKFDEKKKKKHYSRVLEKHLTNSRNRFTEQKIKCNNLIIDYYLFVHIIIEKITDRKQKRTASVMQSNTRRRRAYRILSQQ